MFLLASRSEFTASWGRGERSSKVSIRPLSMLFSLYLLGIDLTSRLCSGFHSSIGLWDSEISSKIGSWLSFLGKPRGDGCSRWEQTTPSETCNFTRFVFFFFFFFASRSWYWNWWWVSFLSLVYADMGERRALRDIKNFAGDPSLACPISKKYAFPLCLSLCVKVAYYSTIQIIFIYLVSSI